MGKRWNKENFISSSKELYKDKYTYEKVIYKNYRTPVIITCPLHGDFTRKPVDFLSKHLGCRFCGIEKRTTESRDTTEDFIRKAKFIHGDRYDYSESIYKGSHEDITIICKIHGRFTQKAYSHLNGHQCPKCGDIEKSKNKLKKLDEFINEAKKIHGDKYLYNDAIYIGNHKALKIYCPLHGAFYQTPQCHLNGAGCPVCVGSNGEQIIWQFLTEHNIKFAFQKRFENCKNILELPFDFYLPEYNSVIEYQGEQHFKYIPFFDKNEESFILRQKRDGIKKKFCEENNIGYIQILYNQNIREYLEVYFYEKL